MSICETIYNQLGGGRFAVMTGTKFVSDGKNNTLRCFLIRNKSKANRLFITYNPGLDTYTMRFIKHSAPRFYKKTCRWSDEKNTEIKTVEDVYCDQLAEIFEDVTGLYTRF